MKKKIISILLNFCVISGVIPVISFAASDTPMYKVTNIETHITLGGTRYIEYDFNGAHYDSRDCGATFNTNAFKCMSLADQQKVAGWYLPSSERTEQFGETGVGLLCDCINEKTGWAQGFKVIADRIADKYFEELKAIYGGEDGIGEDDMYYNLTVKKLTNLTEGTNAYKVYKDYSYAPEAQVFMLKYNAITEMMEKGKEAYNACVTDMMKAREAGSKGVGTWLIKFIVSNMITVHGIFTKPVASLSAGTELLTDAAQSFINDGLNTYVGDIDKFNKKVAELTGIENASGLIIMDRTGAALDNLYGSGTDIKDAAKLVKQMREHADKSAELAKYCYEEASRYSSELEGDATQVIRYIEEREARERLAYEQKERERARLGEDIAESTDNVERDSGYYNAVTSIYVYPAEDTEEAREAAARLQAERRANKASEEWAVVSARFELWKKSLNDAIEQAAQSADFVTVNSEDDVNYLDGNNYFVKSTGYSFIAYDEKYEWNTDYDLTSYQSRIPDRYMQTVKSDRDNAIVYYNKRADKIQSFANKADSMLNKYITSFQEIYSLAKGISDTGYAPFSISSVENEAKNELRKISNINSYSVNADIYADKAKVVAIEENYNNILEENRNYKEHLADYRDKKLSLISDYEFAMDAYINAGAARKKLINESMPDYVRAQKVDYVVYGYNTGAERLNVSAENKELKAMITEAYNRGYNHIAGNGDGKYDQSKAIEEGNKERSQLLRREANRLQPYYEDLLKYEKRMSNAWDQADFYLDMIQELELNEGSDVNDTSYEDYSVSDYGVDVDYHANHGYNYYSPISA